MKRRIQEINIEGSSGDATITLSDGETIEMTASEFMSMLHPMMRAMTRSHANSIQQHHKTLGNVVQCMSLSAARVLVANSLDGNFLVGFETDQNAQIAFEVAPEKARGLAVALQRLIAKLDEPPPIH